MTIVQDHDRSRDPDEGERIFQQCLPFGAGAQHAQVRRDDIGWPEGSFPFDRLYRAVSAANADLAHQHHYTVQQCARLEKLLLKAQAIVRESIALLDSPGSLASPWHAALLRLRSLHRMLMETLVVAHSVAGLLAPGLIDRNRCDSYGQLCDCIKAIQKSCCALAALFSSGISAGSAKERVRLVAVSA